MRGPCEGCGRDRGVSLRRWVDSETDLMLCPGCYEDIEREAALHCLRCGTEHRIHVAHVHTEVGCVDQILCHWCWGLADAENLMAAERF
jgi:hypothetical protein